LAAEGGASAGKDGGKSDAEPEQYLEKAVAKALGLLEKSGKENGFFLMVESAIIDGYGHNNDSDGMIEEMAEFNRTLKFLVKYVENHPNTLLVVTADHETGGTSVGYKSYNVGEKSPVALTFSTKGHSGTVVPVFAYGEGAEYFGGVMKNTDIPWRIERLMNN
ncbi:MAG: alkaline phosphatase, partial [Bacteroidales bacterium]|nr:alkaline phosphatase [Bacteroidales bacterium]